MAGLRTAIPAMCPVVTVFSLSVLCGRLGYVAVPGAICHRRT